MTRGPASSRQETARRDVTGRRGVLLAAAGGGLGAAGALLGTASPAGAASGSPVLAGKSVDAGSGTTSLTSSSTTAVLALESKGSGYALKATGKSAHAVIGYAPDPERYALYAWNTSKETGDGGGALRGRGDYNPGLLATTKADVTDVPAIVATGGAGAGIALLATGDSYLDGSAFALRNYVGALASDGSLDYAPVTSSDEPEHHARGKATLNGSGSATITLASGYRAAVDLATLVVQLTAVGTAMPNLRVTVTSTGFTIDGGSSGGSVFWTASARRVALEFATASAATASAATAGAAPSSASVGGSADSAPDGAGTTAPRARVRAGAGGSPRPARVAGMRVKRPGLRRFHG